LTAAAATSSAACAWRVPNQILSELPQFGPIELAVAVSIEGHRTGDNVVDRRRSGGTTSSASSAPRTTTARTTATRAAGSWRTVRARASIAGPPVFGRTIAGTSGSTGSAFCSRVATELFSGVLASCCRSARSSVRMQFVLGELSVAVRVEFLESGRRVGDLFRREHAVMVGVEQLHQGIARKPVAPPALVEVATGRPLSIILVIAARRNLRRLRDDDRCAQGTKDSDNVKRPTHVRSPIVCDAELGKRHFPRCDAIQCQIRSQKQVVVTDRWCGVEIAFV
jgi:hypothetical protein